MAKPFNLTLQQKGLVLVAVPLVLELTFVLLLSLMMTQAEQAAKREARAKEIEERVNYICSLSENLCNNTVLYAQTAQSQYKRIHDVCMERLPVEIKALAAVVAGNSREAELVDHADTMKQLQMNAAQVVLTTGQMPETQAKPLRVELWHSAYFLQTELQELLRLEAFAGASRLKEQAKWREQARSLLFGGVTLDVLATLSLAALFMAGIVNRVKIMIDNTKKLAADEELNATLGGADEIAQLDHTFHSMADALKESMRKEKALIENTVDIICSLDAEGRFVKANIATWNLWGYSPIELSGRNYRELIAPQDVRSTERALYEIVESKSAASFETRVVCENGLLMDTIWSVQFSPAENALFCVIHDNRERKKLDRLKQEFVSIVSHDLRTPLTSILGGLAILKTGKVGEEKQNQIIANSERSGERLLRLISDLLDLEKMEAGKFQLELANASLQPILNGSAEAVREFAAQNSITLNVPDTTLSVVADVDRVEQVVINLLSNAIKFSPAGSSVAMQVSERNGLAEVRVVDQGSGIPSNHRKAIFEKFEQVRISDAKVKKGTGLGLPICKAIIEQHGGTIGVESEEGKGSTFWFTLPVAPNANYLE
jgi:PAS domain S-box-containing protein